MSSGIPRDYHPFKWNENTESLKTSRSDEVDELNTRMKKISRHVMEDNTPTEITWEILKSKYCRLDQQLAFLDQCKDVNARSADGDSYFFLCLKNAMRYEVVMKCFEKGANVEATDKNGHKPLWVFRDVLENDYKWGFDYNKVYCALKEKRTSVPYNHTTIIHEASKRGLNDLVLSAVKYGQSIFMRNHEGKTALAFIIKNADTRCRNTVMEELLEKADPKESLHSVEKWREIMKGDALLRNLAALVTSKNVYGNDLLSEDVKLDLFKSIPFHEYMQLFLKCTLNLEQAEALLPLFSKAGRRCITEEEIEPLKQQLKSRSNDQDHLSDLLEIINSLKI